MPRIHEVFGYPLTDTSKVAITNRKACRCPFMDAPCDGGGNRYLSDVDLSKDKELSAYFNGRRSVPSGVCSIQLKASEAPWVVCPRRLLCLGRKDSGERAGQSFAQQLLLSKCNYPEGARIGVWSELKMIHTPSGSSGKRFDYTFDYVLMPIGRVSSEHVCELLGGSWPRISAKLQLSGYSMHHERDQYFVDDFPIGKPTIIEIMTSSTSGGNKSKGSTVPASFINAIRGKDHTAPGINYRQVWARMVSQLIVKSEVALNWGGLAFWVLQDNLINYISGSTALDLRSFLSKTAGEVNIIGLSYGDGFNKRSGLIQLDKGSLYSGPIGPPVTGRGEAYFQDMIKAPVKPPLSALMRLLANRSPTAVIHI